MIVNLCPIILARGYATLLFSRPSKALKLFEIKKCLDRVPTNNSFSTPLHVKFNTIKSCLMYKLSSSSFEKGNFHVQDIL